MQLSSILARSVAGHQAANLGGLPKAVVDLLNSLKLQANGDAFATGEGLSFSFTGSDLLGNDGGVTKSLVSVQATSASGATITSAGGVFSYDPGVRFDWLGAGETALDSFSYTIRNAAGQTSTATVTVTVTGENAPVLFDDPLPAVAQMSELTRNEDHPDGDGAVHLVSGAFGFHDADLSDVHFGLSIDPHGEGYVGSFNLPELTDGLGAGTVGWSFQLQEWEIDYLAEGETLTQSYDVTIADIHGSTATKTVSVEIAGRNDAPVAEALSGTVRAWGSSSFRPSDVSFAPLFDDLDRSDTHTVTTDEHGAVGMVRTHPDGTFTYDDMRRFAWLGEGETATDSFTYTVTDNHGAADTETVTVTLQGTNDEPVAQGILAVMKAHDAPLRLTPAFTDADLHDTHRIEVPLIGRGNAAVNADGTITYDPGHAFDYLRVGETATDTFLYEVNDNHGGRASNLVTVHIRGDNFAPVIADPVQAAELKELNDTIFAHAERMAGGAIHYKDADVGDRVTASIAGQTVQAFDWAGRALALNEAQVAGIKASFHLGADQAGGAFGWGFQTFDRNLDFLDDGDRIVLTNDVVLDDHDTGLAHATVTVTLFGCPEPALPDGIHPATDWWI